MDFRLKPTCGAAKRRQHFPNKRTLDFQSDVRDKGTRKFLFGPQKLVTFEGLSRYLLSCVMPASLAGVSFLDLQLHSPLIIGRYGVVRIAGALAH